MSNHQCELSTLFTIAQNIALRSGQQEMLRQILDILEQRLGMIRGTIMLVSPDGAELVVEAAHAKPEVSTSQIRYQRGEGINSRVFESGHSAIIKQISAEPEFQDRIHRRYLDPAGEYSFICVPIMLDKEIIGTLSADLPFDENASLEEAEQILCIVAAMIANDAKNRRVALLERAALEDENRRLLDALKEQFRPEKIIGNSRAMRDVYTRIHQVSGSHTSVLIRGESGTGKELAAAIHYDSTRSNRPFVKLNCAALNESLMLGPREHLPVLLDREPPPLAREMFSEYLVSARLLGQRAASTHCASASIAITTWDTCCSPAKIL